jgi:uncharacterized protein YndB with AHSA1/START domain
MRVEESIELPQTPEDVWEFVADPMNDPLWCPKVQSVEPRGEGRWVVTHKPVPLRPPMELSLEHVELDRPRRLVLREEDEASVFEVEYRLEPVASGTVFTQLSEFSWKKLPRFLHLLFGHGVRRDLRRQLRSLRDVLS